MNYLSIAAKRERPVPVNRLVKLWAPSLMFVFAGMSSHETFGTKDSLELTAASIHGCFCARQSQE
jgi:hypothetical protein